MRKKSLGDDLRANSPSDDGRKRGEGQRSNDGADRLGTRSDR